MQTRIQLIIDDQPGSLLRVIGGLSRTGFALENHRVARAQHVGHYQVGLKLRGAALPLDEVETFLCAIDGVIKVSKVRTLPYDEIRYDRFASAPAAPSPASSTVEVFTHLLADQLLEDIALSWADTGESDHVMALVDHLVAVYPQTASAVAKIEGVLRRHHDRNLLVRNLGVRTGRRVASIDQRARDTDDVVIILDKLAGGYIFPFARGAVSYDAAQDPDVQSDPLMYLTVAESPFVYRRGRTLKLGSRRDPCTWLEGFIEGVIDHSSSSVGVEVEETACIARGAKACVFTCEPRS